MNTKMSRFVTILVAAALLTACAGTAFAQTETPPGQKGTGRAVVGPDRMAAPV